MAGAHDNEGNNNFSSPLNVKPESVTPESIAMDLYHWKDYTIAQFNEVRDVLDKMNSALIKNTAATMRGSDDLKDVKGSIAELKDVKGSIDDALAILQFLKASKRITIGLGTFALWFMSVVSSVTIIVQSIRGKLW